MEVWIVNSGIEYWLRGCYILPMTLGEALLIARRRAGLSQAEIAEAIGVSGAFVSMIERDQKPFPRDRLERLPESIREVVTEAMAADLEAQAARLRGNDEATRGI